MSSHREAPESSKDPVADNTDTYCFVSPDRPDTVTMITNYIPLEDPVGGPNFFEFGDDVLYRDQRRQHRRRQAGHRRTSSGSTPTIGNPNTFLYNTGPIDRLHQPELQPAPDATRSPRSVAVDAGCSARDLLCPPCNVGPRSTPNYAGAGQLGDLHRRQRHQGVRRSAARGLLRRPRRGLRSGRAAPVPEPAPDPDAGQPTASTRCRRSTSTRSRSRCRSRQLTRNGGRPTDPMRHESRHRRVGLGVPAEGQLPRRQVRLGVGARSRRSPGSGMPLFNEVIVPMSRKDRWNACRSRPGLPVRQVRGPARAGPAAAGAVPGRVPEPEGLHQGAGRPAGDPAHRHPRRCHHGIPELHRADAGGRAAAQRRHPAEPRTPTSWASSVATWPGSRTAGGCSTTSSPIELQAVAGATIPLVDPTFTPDGAATLVTDGVTPPGNVSYLDVFPYLDHPVSGYDVKPLAV